MYKRLSLKNILCKTSSINLIVFWSFFLSFQNNWSQTNVTNNYSNDTIVVVITNENKELRGLLISEDYNLLTVQIANENKKFNKNEIKSYRFIIFCRLWFRWWHLLTHHHRLRWLRLLWLHLSHTTLRHTHDFIQ